MKNGTIVFSTGFRTFCVKIDHRAIFTVGESGYIVST